MPGEHAGLEEGDPEGEHEPDQGEHGDGGVGRRQCLCSTCLVGRSEQIPETRRATRGHKVRNDRSHDRERETDTGRCEEKGQARRDPKAGEDLDAGRVEGPEDVERLGIDVT
jgi:hypothetical protein